MTAPASDVRAKISACVITLNEEFRLPRCLESLRFVDEVIVLDSESTDNTCKLAADFGAQIHIRKFDGFVNQKNHAVSLARHDWILVVDADEVVSPSLREEILEVLRQSGGTHAGYRVPRISHYLGRWIRHSGWYPDYNIRLFRRDKTKFIGGTVHERAEVQGSVGTLRGHLEHYSYRNVSQHLQRMDRYSDLIAQDKHKSGERSSVTWAVLKGVSKFAITYFYRLGFLDGRAGLVIAILAGYYNFLKYIKLWELNRGEGS